VYCLLGLLLDQGQAAWAVELSKQLMYADGEQSIDYSAMGWALAQVRVGGGTWCKGGERMSGAYRTQTHRRVVQMCTACCKAVSPCRSSSPRS
jgi:hypothetical protein